MVFNNLLAREIAMAILGAFEKKSKKIVNLISDHKIYVKPIVSLSSHYLIKRNIYTLNASRESDVGLLLQRYDTGNR